MIGWVALCSATGAASPAPRMDVIRFLLIPSMRGGTVKARYDSVVRSASTGQDWLRSGVATETVLAAHLPAHPAARFAAHPGHPRITGGRAG
jgi:hypothetical protein